MSEGIPPGPVDLSACDSLQLLPQGGLGRAVHTLIVLNLWAAVTVVALLQAVIEQAQVLFYLLGLVYRVRVQDLWDQAQRAVRDMESPASQARPSSLPAMGHTPQHLSHLRESNPGCGTTR